MSNIVKTARRIHRWHSVVQLELELVLHSKEDPEMADIPKTGPSEAGWEIRTRMTIVSP